MNYHLIFLFSVVSYMLDGSVSLALLHVIVIISKSLANTQRMLLFYLVATPGIAMIYDALMLELHYKTLKQNQS